MFTIMVLKVYFAASFLSIPEDFYDLATACFILEIHLQSISGGVVGHVLNHDATCDRDTLYSQETVIITLRSAGFL